VKGNLRLVSVFSALAGVALAAAASPQALSQAQGGLWQVERSGSTPVRLCIANPLALAQFEHRGSSCSQKVIRDSGTVATIHYTCAGSNFGQSDLTLVTPRSLRVTTQGISANAPFKYTFQARRVGDCPAH
jgi:hypothetical protein